MSSPAPAAASLARAIAPSTVTALYAADESALVRALADEAALPPAERDLVLSRATELVARDANGAELLRATIGGEVKTSPTTEPTRP